MDESSTSLDLGPPPPNPGPPPLRIHHYLIWTTLTAAIVAGCMAFDRTFRNGPAIENPVIVAGLVLGAVSIAGIISCAGFGFYWQKKGYAFPKSPGEWLLIMLAKSVGALLAAFALFLAIFFVFGDDDWFPTYYFAAGIALFAGWERLNARGMQTYADTRAWRALYVIMMLIPALLIWEFIASSFPVSIALAAVIAGVLWAAASDWRRGIDRSWVHWCGVLFTISLCVSLQCVFGF